MVGLDLPRLVSLGRLIRRTVGRVVRRTPVCNGNFETWRSLLPVGDSILRWHFASFAGKRARLRRWPAEPGFPPIVVLHSAVEVERWCAQLTPVPAGQPVAGDSPAGRPAAVDG